MGEFSNLTRIIKQGEEQIRKEKEQEEKRLQKYFDDKNRRSLNNKAVENMSWSEIELKNELGQDHSTYIMKGGENADDQADPQNYQNILHTIEQLREIGQKTHPHILPMLDELERLLEEYQSEETAIAEDDNSSELFDSNTMGKSFKKSQAKKLKNVILKELKKRNSKYYGLARCDILKLKKETEEEIARREMEEQRQKWYKEDEDNKKYDNSDVEKMYKDRKRASEILKGQSVELLLAEDIPNIAKSGDSIRLHPDGTFSLAENI